VTDVDSAASTRTSRLIKVRAKVSIERLPILQPWLSGFAGRDDRKVYEFDARVGGGYRDPDTVESP
jgi:hypothetical protein